MADSDKRLKIFKGTSCISELPLLDAPTALCTFYTDAHSRPRTPAVAVACGSYVFIYRNLRPYFKFTLPAVDVDPKEAAIWEALRVDRPDVATAVDSLVAAREAGTVLTSRSVDLISIEAQAAREAYVKEARKHALSQ